MLSVKRSEQREFEEVDIEEGYYPAMLLKIKETERGVYKKPEEKEPIYRLVFHVRQDDGTEVFVTKDMRPSLALKPKMSALAAFLKAVTGESDNAIIGFTDQEVDTILNRAIGKNYQVDVVVTESKTSGKKYAKIDKVRLDKTEAKISLVDSHDAPAANDTPSDDDIPF